MGRILGPNRSALWYDRVRRQEASGLSIKQFCAQEGVARSHFHAWKRQLLLSGPPGEYPALPAPSTFLPVTVRVAERAPDGPPPHIEVELPNGICLRIPTADGRLACRLVRAVAKAKTHWGGSR
jgi:hypothetical protein